MRNAITRALLITIALSLLCVPALTAQELASPVPAAQPRPAYKPFDIGLSAGLVMPGNVWISAADAHVVNSASLFFKGHFDAYIVEKLAMGLYGSITLFKLDHVDEDNSPIPSAYNSVTAYEIGCAIKPCFRLSEKVSLKPALEIGYRRMTLDFFTGVSGANSTNGMALGGGFAFKYQAAGVAPFASLGITSQPVGGNNYTDVSYPPMFTLAAGVEF